MWSYCDSTAFNAVEPAVVRLDYEPNGGLILAYGAALEFGLCELFVTLNLQMGHDRPLTGSTVPKIGMQEPPKGSPLTKRHNGCLLYTSDAADE